MPTQELGRPAHRKYDIEAWMPGRDSYGEVGLLALLWLVNHVLDEYCFCLKIISHYCSVRALGSVLLSRLDVFVSPLACLRSPAGLTVQTTKADASISYMRGRMVAYIMLIRWDQEGGYNLCCEIQYFWCTKCNRFYKNRITIFKFFFLKMS